MILSLWFIAYSACTPNQPAAATEAPLKETVEVLEPEPTSIPPSATTPVSILDTTAGWAAPFCVEPELENEFQIECSDGALIISQSPARKGVDIAMERAYPLEYKGDFDLQVSTISSPYEINMLDVNQYGLFLTNPDEIRYKLLLKGQMIGMEIWSIGEIPTLVEKLNMTYSDFLAPQGEKNTFKLACRADYCDLFINDNRVTRLPIDMSKGINQVGIHSSSAWDEKFGSVVFEELNITATPAAEESLPPLEITDDLRSDHNTFSTLGLAGAFHDYMEDGFHFSPLIPFDYYATTVETLFSDVVISTMVVMDINPEQSASQYGGVICRSSDDGFYGAVIRADGTYSIYRYTPQRSFALLAEKRSEAIRSGREENKITLECKGQQINFFINDIQVESLVDTRYGLRFGRVGLFTKAGSEPNPDAIVFRDLIIK